MSRVSTKSMQKLTAFMDALPPKTRDKCAICNKTLTHLVKTAESKTGAGTATVTKALADKINETAAPEDRVSDKALTARVRWEDGTDKRSPIIRESDNKPDSVNEEPEAVMTEDSNNHEPIEDQKSEPVPIEPAEPEELNEPEDTEYEELPIMALGEKEVLKKAKEIQAEKREIKRAGIIEKLESIEAVEAKKASGVYDVIVIDPPWPMQKIERDERPNQSEFDYPVMSEQELEILDIPCADDCHIFVWTTHKFLPMAFRLLDRWGLKYVCCMVWHKPGGFQAFNLPQYNCEFCLYVRKGSPSFIDTKAFPVCFSADRGAHSEKPEEFYSIIRRVTGGRRLDLFNRRMIDGFDGFGKESP